MGLYTRKREGRGGAAWHLSQGVCVHISGEERREGKGAEEPAAAGFCRGDDLCGVHCPELRVIPRQETGRRKGAELRRQVVRHGGNLFRVTRRHESPVAKSWQPSVKAILRRHGITSVSLQTTTSRRPGARRDRSIAQPRPARQRLHGVCLQKYSHPPSISHLLPDAEVGGRGSPMPAVMAFADERGLTGDRLRVFVAPREIQNPK